ncbi:MAG: phosphate ABC transporter permease PstA [Bacteroidota bacterium]|nr:phosphate ABC transporter permease PstA [Bacteroidota bacterium]
MSAEHDKIARKKRIGQNVAFWTFRVLSIGIAGVLFWILGFIVVNGAKAISWDFLTKMPTEGMTKGGIMPAIVGTLTLVAGSMIFAFPLGIMAGIYMNEYAKEGFLKRLIQVMTNNLSGIPSIVFGLFGMSLFVNKMHFGDSILAGSLTLGILVLPIVIRTTEEALKAVDDSFRIGSLALGASKWQTTSRVILPSAFPNIITGLILSIGRVSGETAPILFTCAAYFLPKLPDSIFDQVMALPYHLYVIATSGTNITESRPIAYGTALVLIAIVLIMNILANVLRRYFGKKVKTN